MKEALRLLFRGRGRETLDLQCRPSKRLDEESRDSEILQMIDDPRVLARGDIDDCRDQETLAWSISLGDLPHKRLEKNPFRSRPDIQENEAFVAFKNEIPVANHSHETKSLRRSRNPIGTLKGRIFRQRNHPLWRFWYKNRLRANRLRRARQPLTRTDKRSSRTVKYGPLQCLRAPEAHFALRGMDVAVDEFEVHLDVKHADRVLTSLKYPKIRLAKGLLNSRAMNGASVQYDKLLKAIPSPMAGTGYETRKSQSLAFESINFEELRQMPAAEQISNANRQAFRSRKRGDGNSVPSALERHRRIRKDNSVEAVHNMSRLCLFASKKLMASWEVVEQVAHLDLRSRRRPNFPNSFDSASRHDHLRAGLR